MSNLQLLNAFLSERFTTVAVEICEEVDKTLTVYQEEISRSVAEIDRLRRILHIVTQPKIKLHRTDVQQVSISEEEVHPGHHHNKHEWSPSLGRDPESPQTKEETAELLTSQEEKCQGLESDTSIKKFSASFVKSDFGQVNPHTCSQPFHTQTLKNREQDLLSASTTEAIKTEPEEDRYRLPTPTCDSQPLPVATSYSSVSAFKYQLIDVAHKPYQCNVCGKYLKRERSLIVHRMGHAGDKPFTCPICNKGFVALGTLKTHLKLHTGERPHRCFVCGRCFKLKGALTEHMRIHTGEKPFRCQDCGKCFSRTNALTNHMLQIHKKKRT